MPRTRVEAQYTANRQRILDEAAHLFAAKGFPRTTIVELATACQCSKALLYHYFASKEDILYALLTTHLQHLRAVAEEALSVSDEPVEQFYALTQANMSLYIESRDRHVVLVSDTGHLSEAQREEIRHMQRVLTSLVSELLTRLNPQLLSDPRLPMVYTMMFYGVLNWTYIWYDADGSVGPDEFSRRAADLFLNGFAPR
jgi:AcrR family transcriptional regulator